MIDPRSNAAAEQRQQDLRAADAAVPAVAAADDGERDPSIRLVRAADASSGVFDIVSGFFQGIDL